MTTEKANKGDVKQTEGDGKSHTSHIKKETIARNFVEVGNIKSRRNLAVNRILIAAGR
jgi:hypothetical protein